MYFKNWPSWCFLLISTSLKTTQTADDDYNILHRDGSFQFGYDTPDSYHHALGNRNNVVRGEFGGRNPGTGKIDSTQYTAGPRGYRPRGKNIHRKYDLNQNGPRPVGSPDDPYYDPYEDPSYSFEFKTRTYNRQENANRQGDVSGRYNYIDDVGERHNVEFIAGKNTGFHVITPFPDSNPRAFGPLYFRGRGKPIPRGRTSIQRGLDGSYRFVSAGPDQRRTETSDSTGHVRGSYTYVDDKGVQHSVHYIAGPETGYRVLKNVKGPHLPSVYPFGSPEIIPSDFYDYSKDEVFDTAASGLVKPIKPINNNVGGNRPNKPNKEELPSFGGESSFEGDLGKPGIGNEDKETSSETGDSETDSSFNRPPPPRPISGGGSNRPGSGGGSNRPGSGGGSSRPGSGGSFNKPSPGGDFGTPGEGDGFGGDGDDFEDDLFGPSGSRPKPPRPQRPVRPVGGSGISGSGGTEGGGSNISGIGGGGGTGTGTTGSGGGGSGGGGGQRPIPGGSNTDGSYKPDFGDTGDDGSYIPPGDVNQDDGSYKPGPDEAGLGIGGGESPRPGLGGIASGKPTRPSGGSRPGISTFTDDYEDSNGLFGSETNARPPLNNGRPPVIQIQGGSGGPSCERCAGTVVTNVGDKLFAVPPGGSVRAHVQSIDLLPLVSKVPSPSEQYNEDMNIKTEQLNSAASDLVTTTVEPDKVTTTSTTTVATTTFEFPEVTTISE